MRERAAARLLQRAGTWATVTDLSIAFRVSENSASSPSVSASGLVGSWRSRGRGPARPRRPGGRPPGRERQTPARPPGPPPGPPPTFLRGRASLCVRGHPHPRSGRSWRTAAPSSRRTGLSRERLDVIVVDDARRPRRCCGRGGSPPCPPAGQRPQSGPAYSRNRGVSAKRLWQIVAFIDSDCVAKPRWLLDLAPTFAWAAVGAVGGRTIGYYTESRWTAMRRSRLRSIGSLAAYRGEGNGHVRCTYMQSARLRKSAFEQVGGLRDDLQVGEDVDLCWRLRASGYDLVYAPEGIVRHEHRDHLVGMLRRRATTAPRRRRCTDFTALSASAFLSLRLPRPPWLSWRAPPSVSIPGFSAALVPPAWDGVRRTIRLRRQTVNVSAGQIWSAVLRNHLGMLYFAYFHLQRYYLLPLALAGPVAPGAWALGASAVVYSAGVDYRPNDPGLGLPLIWPTTRPSTGLPDGGHRGLPAGKDLSLVPPRAKMRP